MSTPAEVLEFWFGERARTKWFAKDPAFDDEIRTRFGGPNEAAGKGALDGWLSTPDGALALVVLLDQFTRNIHRGSPRAFEHDRKARELARAAIERGFDRALAHDRLMFMYLPFQHSEVLSDQERSVELFTRWASEHHGAERASADEELGYARRHHEIIRRFGRFPHRNATLGRESTAAELAFLAEPGSSF